MERNFGRNSDFKPVSAETEIKECLGWNYLNFPAFILPLLSGERAAFEKTEKLQVVFRTKTTASFFENGSKYKKNHPNFANILSKEMRNISLNGNCAAKSSQNLQISEFIKAQKNSNNFVRIVPSKFSTAQVINQKFARFLTVLFHTGSTFKSHLLLKWIPNDHKNLIFRHCFVFLPLEDYFQLPLLGRAAETKLAN